MTAITPFQFPATGQPVRTVTVDDEPWFVAADVTAVLGYANGRMAVGNLPDRMRNTVTISDGNRGNPNRTVISEPGLYRLAMRSDMPEAEAFQDWIAEEVLPAIRRTGSYSVDRSELPQDFSAALRALADEHDAHRVTRDERDAAQYRVTELEPAADAWNILADAKGDYSLREAAQILNRDPLISTGQNRLSLYLRQIGWSDSSKQPYQDQVNNGRLVRRPTSYPHPRTGEREASSQIRITPKGLKELRRRLSGQQQLTVIEGIA